MGEHHPIHQGLRQNEKAEEGQTCSLLELGHLSCPGCCWFSGLQTQTRTSPAPVLGPSGLGWSCTTSSPGPPACRQQVVRLLRLQSPVSPPSSCTSFYLCACGPASLETPSHAASCSGSPLPAATKMCRSLPPLGPVLFLLQRFSSTHDDVFFKPSLSSPPPSPRRARVSCALRSPGTSSGRQAMAFQSRCPSSMPGTVPPQGLCTCGILSWKPQTLARLMPSLLHVLLRCHLLRAAPLSFRPSPSLLLLCVSS